LRKLIKNNYPKTFLYIKCIKNFFIFSLYYIRIKFFLFTKKPNNKINLIIGSGGTSYKNWIKSNIETINLLEKKSFDLFFKLDSIDTILCEHVFEHLTYEQGKIAVGNIYLYLKKGGFARLAVPDGNHPSQDYIKWVRPGGAGDGASDHKILYNYKSFSEIFINQGFKVKILEYYDENGIFHHQQWNSEDGFIHRSRDNDKRNVNGQINYSSIIIDAMKI